MSKEVRMIEIEGVESEVVVSRDNTVRTPKYYTFHNGLYITGGTVDVVVRKVLRHLNKREKAEDKRERV